MPLHLSLQYLTSSQTFSHFFLHENGLLQTMQIFWGRFSFLICLLTVFFFIILFSIITSIINSSYYLKILKILFFTFSLEFSKITIYNLQGFFIILLTFITFFFIFNADIWLNFFKIISFSIFYYLFFYEFFFYNYSIFYFYYFS